MYVNQMPFEYGVLLNLICQGLIGRSMGAATAILSTTIIPGILFFIAFTLRYKKKCSAHLYSSFKTSKRWSLIVRSLILQNLQRKLFVLR